MEYIFTNHAKYRITKRNLTEQEIIEAIKFPNKTIKKHGKFYAQKTIVRGTIEIVYEHTERYINIITVYWL